MEKKPNIKKVSSNVHTIDFYGDNVVKGWKKYFLLISDIHFDSTKCDRKLLKKHFEKAKKIGAQIMIFGDLFDAMQGRNDRRSNKQALDLDILKTMQKEDREYYDVACEKVISFLKPYKDNVLFISYGNHETAINKHNEFDLLRRIGSELGIEIGAYEGYLRFLFTKDGRPTALTLKYHHGYGGAKRSKGMLDSQMFGFAYPSADICVRGHNHYKFLDTNVAEIITNRHTIYNRKQHYLNLGTYKQKEPGNGWETEKGFFPVALGGWWMEMKLVYELNPKKTGANCKIKSLFFEAD